MPSGVSAAAPPVWFPWAGVAVGLGLGLVGLVVLLRTVPRLRRALRTTGTAVEVHRVHPTRGQFSLLVVGPQVAAVFWLLTR